MQREHETHTAAKDGTAIGAVTPGAIMSALLDGRSNSTFDPTKALFIGTANYGTRICVTMKDAGHQSFEDLLTRKAVIGSAAVNDGTHDYAFMVKNVTGAQLSIVTGYKGTSDIGLAMERREVDGACGWDWASLKSQRGRWLKDKPHPCPHADRARAGRGADAAVACRRSGSTSRTTTTASGSS